MWMMSRTILEDVASRCRLYLAAKPSHVGLDVDGLACLLHRPTVYSRQMSGQGFSSGPALSRRVAVGDGAFLGDAKPQAWIFDGGLTAWVPVLPNLYME
jgi:hypothetical protein